MNVTVVFTDDNVLRNVNQPAGQITGVRCTQRGVCQTFTCAMTGNKVFQNGQAFTEVGFYRTVDDTTGRICHQTAHTGQLFNLVNAAAGTGVSHHGNRVKLIGGVGIFQQSCYILGRLVPDLYDFLIPFFICHQTAAVHRFSLVDQFFGGLNNLMLALGHVNIGNGNGDTGLAGVIVTHLFHDIQHVGRSQVAVQLMGFGDQFPKFLLGNQLPQMPVFFSAFFIFPLVEVAQFFRQRFIINGVTDGSVNQAHPFRSGFTHNIFVRDQDLDFGLQVQILMVICHQRLM